MEFQDIGCRYKQIKGYEDYYVTENGEIYSAKLRKGDTERTLRKLCPKNPGKDSKYYNIVLSDSKYVPKTFSIHRLVAEYFVPGYFDGAVVNHIDGNNRNNCYTNLEWVTTAENIHKSYQTSGVSQLRNFQYLILVDPDGHMTAGFQGGKELGRYIKQNNLDTSVTSLIKYGESRGYKVIKLSK